MKLSLAERRRYIKERIHNDWGWVNWEKGLSGYSYRDMVAQIQRAYPSTVVSAMTVRRDILAMREEAKHPSNKDLTEAQRLLLPENFPEWRAKFFIAPNGKPFETPPHQFALFWVMYSMTHKVELPQWVIDYLNKMDPERPLPEDINEKILAEDEMLSFEFLMAPRHGKTDTVIHFIIHTHCGWPHKRILFGNGTLKKTESFIANYIMPILEGHPELIKLYGPFENEKGSWSRSGYILKQRPGFDKMANLQPFGLQGNVRSFGADIIIGDDLSDLRRARSENTTEGDAEWVRTELMTRREANTPFLHLGSHLPIETGDIFEHLEDALQDINNVDGVTSIIKKIPAHNYERCDEKSDPLHEKCVAWPTLRPKKWLEGMRVLMDDDVMFEAVYNQVSRSKEMMHFPAHILREPFYLPPKEEHEKSHPLPKKNDPIGALDMNRSWQTIPQCCGQECLVTMGFDPAKSEQKGSSFTAIVVRAGCPVCGRRYLVDFWKERQSPELHPQAVEMMVRAYPAIQVVRFEVNALQAAISRDPRMVKLAMQYRFEIDEKETDERKWDYSLGIPQMARFVKSGMLSIPWATLGDQDYGEVYVRELIRWPKKPNDLVMADWLAEGALFELIEQAQHVQADIMPGTEDQTTPWHEQITYEVDLAEIGWDDQMEYVEIS